MAEEWSCETCEHSGDTGCWSTKLCDHGSEYTPIKKNRSGKPSGNYEQSCSLECIQVMELAFGAEAVKHFCMCNAFKYMWRYKNKNGMEDLNKAEWYLDYASDYVGLDNPTYEFMDNLLQQLMEGEQDDSE